MTTFSSVCCQLEFDLVDSIMQFVSLIINNNFILLLLDEVERDSQNYQGPRFVISEEVRITQAKALIISLSCENRIQ